jgi:hypothetical protein
MSDEQRAKKAGDLAAFPGRPVGMGSVVGMSKREFFAIEVLAALASKYGTQDCDEQVDLAVQQADKLIKQLNEKKD